MLKKNKKNLIFLGICFVLVFLVYSQTLFGDFVFDDRSIVGHESLLENLNNIPQVLSMGYWNIESGLYRPVVLSTYLLNYSFFGSSPFSFHLVNLILYALIGYLIFLLIKRFFPKKQFLSYIVPVLFLVLPIHTEVVSNIVGRAEILALLFSLLAFLEIIKKKVNPWVLAIYLFLALGSKEVAIAAWPIALLIVFYKDKLFSFKKLFKKYFIPLFAPIFIYFTARILVLGSYFFVTNATIVENPLKFASFFQRISTSLQILVLYIKKIFWPFNLCSDYSYNQITIAETFLI